MLAHGAAHDKITQCERAVAPECSGHSLDAFSPSTRAHLALRAVSCRTSYPTRRSPPRRICLPATVAAVFCHVSRCCPSPLGRAYHRVRRRTHSLPATLLAMNSCVPHVAVTVAVAAAASTRSNAPPFPTMPLFPSKPLDSSLQRRRRHRIQALYRPSPATCGSNVVAILFCSSIARPRNRTKSECWLQPPVLGWTRDV
eukprot:1683645-Pleurochrysis_carterae.AAC.2